AVVDRQEAHAQALHLLPRQGHSGESLADALQAFVEAFPDSPHAPDFARAAGRRDEWRAIDAWEALTAAWETGPAPRNAADAATRLQAVRDYLGKHPRSPLRPQVERYEAHLSAIVLVSSPSDPWQDHLRK